MTVSEFKQKIKELETELNDFEDIISKEEKEKLQELTKNFIKKVDNLKIIEKIVKLKDGTYASVIREWNWKENPYLKIETNGQRLYEDFVDVELNAELENSYTHGANPRNSKFNTIQSTICKSDVEFIEKL